MNGKILPLFLLCVTVTVCSAQTKIKDGSITSITLPNINAILELESSNKGLLLPRVKLASTNNATPLTEHVAGMTVYNTELVADVLPGYYYNDGAHWVKLGGGALEPWNVQNTLTPAEGNTQDIYQMGRVAINKNNTDKQLEVAGDLKAQYDNGGFHSGINTNYENFGNLLYVTDAQDLNASTQRSTVLLSSGMANMQSGYGAGGGSLGTFSDANGGTVGFVANNADASISSEIWGYSKDANQSYVFLSHKKQAGESAKVQIEKSEGVSFHFETAGGAPEGGYIFPRNGGASGQVLVTDGSGANAQLAWEDVPALEPWQVQGSTVRASSNDQKIYQTGDVAIGQIEGRAGVTLDVFGTVRSGSNHNLGLVGINSAAFGQNNQASGENAIALGRQANASGANSLATGYSNTASGEHSVTMGYNSVASGLGALAKGHMATASGYLSTAIGDVATATGDLSFAMGNVTEASSFLETVMGFNNAIKTGNSSSQVPTDGLLQIGNGTSGPGGNALTILKNGNTAIGVEGAENDAKPTERLDIGLGDVYAGNKGSIRIRAINSGSYTGNVSTDNIVVADPNGVLKSVAVSNVTNKTVLIVPEYASDALADSDITLPSGALYRISGGRAVYQKP